MTNYEAHKKDLKQIPGTRVPDLIKFATDNDIMMFAPKEEWVTKWCRKYLVNVSLKQSSLILVL